jgi:hypothetical protein
MLELVEIQRVASQGMTKPLLCKGADGKLYYVKGKRANASGLIKEWMVANLAKAFGLPIPNFYIAYIDQSLLESFGDEAIASLGFEEVFASEQIGSATDVEYQMVGQIDKILQKDILLFDLWIENADRTLTPGFSGNPNLLWDSFDNKLYVIDHNLAFDNEFSLDDFWGLHVFCATFPNKHIGIEEQTVQAKLKKSLTDWSEWWNQLPEEWLQQNNDSKFFDHDTILKRLVLEADGAIWVKCQ